MAVGIQGNIDDFKNLRLWRGVAAEFVGTLVLVLIGCGTCIGEAWEKVTNPTQVQISLAFGLIVATVVWSIGNISGGHVNPAVTVGLLVGRKITVVRALAYVVSQSLGAATGTAILKGLTPSNENEAFGVTTIWSDLSVGQGFGVEVVITFILVFCVFASIDSKRKDLNGSTPLTIGFAVTVCHLFAIKYTGSSMNPARSFGPALVSNKWNNHWVYWLGPITGGIIAALLYELLFSESASPQHAVSFFTSPTHGEYEVNPEASNGVEGKKKKAEAEAAV